MPFPEILLALRLSNGLSQQQLAERANVAEITIQNYESGRSNPVPTRLLAIADVLGVSLDTLVGRDERVLAARLRPADGTGEVSFRAPACGLSDNPQGTSERPILDATCEAIIAKLMGAPDDVVREAMNYVEYLTAKAERRMRQERKEHSLKRMADKGDAEKGEP